jgi:hypothetical protein
MGPVKRIDRSLSRLLSLLAVSRLRHLLQGKAYSLLPIPYSLP